MKSPEKKATIPTPKKEIAKVINGKMEVVVTAKKFGIYVKGDTLTMSESTARACVKNQVVKFK